MTSYGTLLATGGGRNAQAGTPGVDYVQAPFDEWLVVAGFHPERHARRSNWGQRGATTLPRAGEAVVAPPLRRAPR